MRRPGNAIGWLLCAGGIQSGLQIFVEQYSVRAFLAQPGSLPFAESVAWVRNWFWVLGVGLVVGLVLPLFPTGRPISRRWKLALWWSIFSTALMSFGFAFLPGPLSGFPFFGEPTGAWRRRWANEHRTGSRRRRNGNHATAQFGIYCCSVSQG